MRDDRDYRWIEHKAHAPVRCRRYCPPGIHGSQRKMDLVLKSEQASRPTLKSNDYTGFEGQAPGGPGRCSSLRTPPRGLCSSSSEDLSGFRNNLAKSPEHTARGSLALPSDWAAADGMLAPPALGNSPACRSG